MSRIKTTTDRPASRLSTLAQRFDREKYRTFTQTMSVTQYVENCYDQPQLVRSAYQRLFDMIMERGVSTITRYRRTIPIYNFFNDEDIPVFGLEETKAALVDAIKGGAGWYGPEKRVLLLHGPVGSSKSTICRLLKKGLEQYSYTPQGTIYTFRWVDLPGDLFVRATADDPMHEDPIRLLPMEMRRPLEDELNAVMKDRAERAQALDKKSMPFVPKLKLTGNLNPFSQFILDRLLEQNDGNWEAVMEKHVQVYRFGLSEANRMGIATFQPKDEKNQDSTELTGDINYGLLGHYGVDSDPRAFSFDGEFMRANRGFMEFIEALKLAKEFLYDLLGACQERQVKPKKFSQIDVDFVLLAHTNAPEYEKLRNDQTMEALRDRTLRIDVPYVTRWSDEQKILLRDFSADKVHKHIAPHTIEIAALWDILTRLKDDNKDGKLDLVHKAELYDGRSLPGWTEDSVKELRDKYSEMEGMQRGMSPRYTQNKISQALVGNHNYINPFIVLNELETGLKNYSLISNEDDRKWYINCINKAKGKLEEILKAEVQSALVSDDNAIVRMCSNYLDNVYAYIEGSKVKDNYTGNDMEPDEALMRSIEEKADVSEPAADDFRRIIAAQVGSIMKKGATSSNPSGTFEWNTNPKLARALEKKLFEDTKDHIKLSALSVGAGVITPEVQEKIDQVKTRMVKQNGYIWESATDVLNFVASIFARGELGSDE